MPTYLPDAKDPNDIETLTWDWSNRLATGETIVTFTATASSDWTAGATAIVGARTSCSMSGGTAGTVASVRGRITTSTGRQLDHTIHMPIEDQ
jgi:hypothetical protein